MESKNILIACTGSVATIKMGEIIQRLQNQTDYRFQVRTLAGSTKFGGIYLKKKLIWFGLFQIKIITTKNAKHFLERSDIPVSADIPILNDEDEWQMWLKRDDPVLHIDLGKWADLMLNAPLDANTLAKMASGICDNLLLCTTRAWNLEKGLFFCPSMNTRMWEHPITQQHIDILKSWGHIEIECISKKLMCGDIGFGAMETPENIVQTIVEYLKSIK